MSPVTCLFDWTVILTLGFNINAIDLVLHLVQLLWLHSNPRSSVYMRDRGHQRGAQKDHTKFACSGYGVYLHPLPLGTSLVFLFPVSLSVSGRGGVCWS